jgi:hypothetical protein
MFFRIRAENFGPLVEKVFLCAEDDGCGTGMSALFSFSRAEQRSRCSHVLGRSRAYLAGLSQMCLSLPSGIYETYLPQLHYLVLFKSVKLSMNINKKLLPI